MSGAKHSTEDTDCRILREAAVVGERSIRVEVEVRTLVECMEVRMLVLVT
jgi:hypothetical protein